MITSTANARVQWIRSLQRKRRARQAEGLFVIEGTRLGEEALRAGVIPRLVAHVPQLDEQPPPLLPPSANRAPPFLPVPKRFMKPGPPPGAQASMTRSDTGR